MAFTVKALEHLPAGTWLCHDTGSRHGTLRAKGGAKGTYFYFRYKSSLKKDVDVALGKFCPKGMLGLSMTQAVERAAQLRMLYMAGNIDLKDYLEEQKRQASAQIQEAERLRTLEAVRRQASLQALMDAYVVQLRQEGKISAKDVVTALQRNISKPYPALAATPADDVTTSELATVLRRLVEQGKKREAAKVRTYLISAYKKGVTASQDASACSELVSLGITKNPARDLASIRGAVNAKVRNLSIPELRSYWRHLCEDRTVVGAALRFHLLTGGMRQQQLGRTTIEDYDPVARVIRLIDYKGNVKRHYSVPLTPLAAQTLGEMCPVREGPYLFTITLGKSGLVHNQLSKKIVPFVKMMRDAGELEHGDFTPGDIRRTVETRLAALGYGKEVRGRLQNHGISGVQDVHYNMHDYMPEKSDALMAIERLLTGTDADVVPLRRSVA